MLEMDRMIKAEVGKWGARVTSSGSESGALSTKDHRASGSRAATPRHNIASILGVRYMISPRPSPWSRIPVVIHAMTWPVANA